MAFADPPATPTRSRSLDSEVIPHLAEQQVECPVNLTPEHSDRAADDPEHGQGRKESGKTGTKDRAVKVVARIEWTK